MFAGVQHPLTRIGHLPFLFEFFLDTGIERSPE